MWKHHIGTESGLSALNGQSPTTVWSDWSVSWSWDSPGHAAMSLTSTFGSEKRRGGQLISEQTASVLVRPLFISPALNMLLLLLLLLPSADGQTQRVTGVKKGDSCECPVDPNLWSFPAVKYEAVQQKVESCQVSLNSLQEQVNLSSQRLPEIQALVNNLTARLEPHQYLNNLGLYSSLPLRELLKELSELETNVGAIHSQLNNAQTQKLSKEVRKLRTDVDRMERSDVFNMKTVKEKLRYLKNSAESCKSIPTDFRGQDKVCLKGLITSISTPVTTKITPDGKTYISGSWGKQAMLNSEGQKNSYWLQTLYSSHYWGYNMYIYQTYEDFMASTNHQSLTIAPSYTDANTVEGPSAVLYGEALYYHCYNTPDVCRYDLKTNTVKRVTLPGTGVGFYNKFPYCYYECRAYSDVDVEADERGLWAIYATMGNHGNIVLSRLVWDSVNETLNVTQTWETRLFKKAVSNAFMVCGVMYATRYVDEFREEVFYAFDTATGKHDESLALPMEKIAKGVASLSYNPTDQQIYMYNDGYLLAYQANF